jgi:hypothetical protein
MSSFSEIRQQEEVVLTRAVENILRKLVRFFVGKISLVKLQEMIRLIFIEEAECKLRTKNPSKGVSLTELFLLTGIDTRTLKKVKNSDCYGQPLYRESEFLKSFTPGASILDIWSTEPPYYDEVSGKPRELAISGTAPSFESLFEKTVKSRGVTYKSLLNRLVESDAVSINHETQKVILVVRSYLPSAAKDTLGSIEMGFSAIGNMVDTVVRNITSIESNEEPFYQQGVWTFRMNTDNQTELRSELRKLLEKTNATARQVIEKHEQQSVSEDNITAGISLFYFEEEPDHSQR